MGKIFGNRGFAVFVCIIVVILSVFVSARDGLSGVVDTAESTFVVGVDDDGNSIAHDLSSRAGLAKNLVTIAKRYMDESNNLITAVENAADRINGEYDPSTAYLANSDLDYAVSKLSEELSGLELSDKDESYRVSIITDMESYDYTIEHDGYNAYIADINGDVLSKFPANILKFVTFVGNAEYYA